MNPPRGGDILPTVLWLLIGMNLVMIGWLWLVLVHPTSEQIRQTYLYPLL